ncbi:hypothetical protein [Nonomuraea sp. CA-141351]|uniref:hypothetical protein n=1 Tax=Nonomuraea sp. CA-141351 TaxID=3239996 RepID=UPI003D8C1D9F
MLSWGCSPTARASPPDALTQLGTAGRVGYDPHEEAHFHREPPYDREQVAQLNPCLTAARAPADSGAVRLLGETAGVTTDGGVRRVRIAEGECASPSGTTTGGRAGRASTCRRPGSPPA